MQDGGSLDQVLKEAKRIPEEILGKVSIAVSCFVSPYVLSLLKLGRRWWWMGAGKQIPEHTP